MNKKITLVVLLIIMIIGCTKNDPSDYISSKNKNLGWLVPFEDIVHTGESKDQISSIDDPQFVSVQDSDWSDDAVMYVYHHNGITKVYPQSLLDGHEIVNDMIDDHYFTITYCPITGSGMCWNRRINNRITEFGVSGILYNENLVPYDRNTNSYWSQMKMQSIYGQLKGSIPEHNLLIQTFFFTVKTIFSDALVLSNKQNETVLSTGPILKNSNDIIDPNNTSNNLQGGSLFYGIISGNKLLVFDYKVFDTNMSIIQTNFNNQEYVIVGSKKYSIIVAFEISQQGLSQRTFMSISTLEGVMKDNLNNVYDLFGNVISGPDTGLKLSPAKSYFSKGFAWNLFFNQIELFKEN